MTDLDAILWAVLADPADDTPRLVYAEICDDLAGVVACPACGGSGCPAPSIRDMPPILEVRQPDGSVVRQAVVEWKPIYKRPVCPRCAGSGSVSNGLAERAEFVRAQVELARRFPAYTKDGVTELGAGGGPAFLGETSKQFNDLRRRERELWGEYSREWFGDSALWLPTDELRRASPHVPGFVVRRGFADEWRGPLSAFVGGECRGCGGRGGEDRYPADDPTNRLMHGSHWYGCHDCGSTGRVGLDLAAVFARHPVRSVRICDREPTHDQSGWYWMTGNNRPDEVPYRLTKHFQRRDKGYTRFPTRDAALSALSLACVNLGRAAAGLDPLT